MGPLERTFVYDVLMFARSLRAERIGQWERAGSPLPPPHHVKQRIVREYARAFSVRTLVETGTYMGDMVYSARKTFEKIVSIELDAALFERAREVFRRFPHISIVHGDSGEVLPDLLAGLREPCLFWLDGHYSGAGTARGGLQTPIARELEAVFRHTVARHVILIDDARLFAGNDDYPTLAQVREWSASRLPNLSFRVKNDVIRIHRELPGFEPAF